MGSTTRGVFFFMSFLCCRHFKWRGCEAVKINGKEIVLAAGTSLLTYLQQQQYQLTRIAVEYNGEILKREQYASVILQPEDCLEIVSFVGGG